MAGFDNRYFAWRRWSPRDGGGRAVLLFEGAGYSDPVELAVTFHEQPYGSWLGSAGALSGMPQQGEAETHFTRAGGSTGFAEAAIAWAVRQLEDGRRGASELIDHGKFRIEIQEFDDGFRATVRRRSSPVVGAGVSMGESVTFGTRPTAAAALAEAKAEIDSGRVW